MTDIKLTPSDEPALIDIHSEFSGPPVIQFHGARGPTDFAASINLETGEVVVNEEHGGLTEAARIFWDSFRAYGRSLADQADEWRGMTQRLYDAMGCDCCADYDEYMAARKAARELLEGKNEKHEEYLVELERLINQKGPRNMVALMRMNELCEYVRITHQDEVYSAFHTERI